MGLVVFFFLGSAKPTFFPEDTAVVINKIKIEITGLSTVGKYNCSNTFTIKDTVYVNCAKKNTFNTEIKIKGKNILKRIDMRLIIFILVKFCLFKNVIKDLFFTVFCRICNF